MINNNFVVPVLIVLFFKDRASLYFLFAFYYYFHFKNFSNIFIYRVVFDRLSGFSLGIRRNRCNRLLQLSDNNWVTLAVELRV